MFGDVTINKYIMEYWYGYVSKDKAEEISRKTRAVMFLRYYFAYKEWLNKHHNRAYNSAGIKAHLRRNKKNRYAYARYYKNAFKKYGIFI